jgi:hypothetical protein
VPRQGVTIIHHATMAWGAAPRRLGAYMRMRMIADFQVVSEPWFASH